MRKVSGTKKLEKYLAGEGSIGDKALDRALRTQLRRMATLGIKVDEFILQTDKVYVRAVEALGEFWVTKFTDFSKGKVGCGTRVGGDCSDMYWYKKDKGDRESNRIVKMIFELFAVYIFKHAREHKLLAYKASKW